MRLIYPDLEFNPFDPTVYGTLSIGIVDDEGREFYAINGAADLLAVGRNPWLVEHVVPHLPIAVHHFYSGGALLTWNEEDPEYSKSALDPDQIAGALAAWLAEGDTPTPVRMYGYYGAQDINRLHGLWDNDWKTMPPQMPRYFTELQSFADALGVTGDDLARAQTSALAHHALDDARWHRALHRHLIDRAQDDWDTGLLAYL